jgi:arylsulfatase A-like enzyme
MKKIDCLPFLLRVCWPGWLLTGCTGGTPSSPPPPNILFILVDDLGYHDLGVTGSTYYETPHIDRLAAGAFRFRRGYAGGQVCSPSRATLLTGQWPARHGITDWIGAASGEAWRSLARHDRLLPADYRPALPLTDTTLAEAFRQAGYHTFFAGKWHLGDTGSAPENHGFDRNIGGFWAGSPHGGFFDPYDNPALPNRKPGENLSVRLAQETADFIGTLPDRPFLAFLSFYAVHAPLETNRQRWEKYREKAVGMGTPSTGFRMERILPIRTVQDHPVYAGMVETMDAAVGIVLDAVERHGLSDNTIVVFTSDNGGVASGDAYATSNFPLRGGKGYQWEGGLRVPFFLHVPGPLGEHPFDIDVPVSGADLYPTLLDLAGLPLRPTQHLDGISLRPLLEGKEWPVRPLVWHYPHYGNQGGEPSSCWLENNFKLIHYWEDGRAELYDLDNDPSETHDLAAMQPARVLALRSRLLAFLDEVGAHRPTPDPLFDAAAAALRQQDIRNSLLPKLEAQRAAFLAPDFSPGHDWWGSVPPED